MKMKYHYRSTQRIATAITVICLMLFVAYSIYLFVGHQSRIVELANFIANGCTTDMPYDTESSVWIASLLGTALCIIPALLLLRSLHFPIYMKALAFLPSYVLLGLITGISPLSVDATENGIPILSTIIFMLISVVAVLYSQVYHEDRGEHATLFNYLAGNILFSCVGIVFCMALTNTDSQLHLQQSLAQAVYRKDYTYANTIPPGETITNNTIMALRVLCLSKQGCMADKLFSIGGLNGSSSLLPDSTPSALVYNTPKMVYNQLQAVPINFNNDVRRFLQKATERRMIALQDTATTLCDSLRARPLMDYYLCALLLDRDLPSFVNELPRFYAQDTTLPRHYSEAIAMYYAEDSLAVRFAVNPSMDSIYKEYTLLKQSNSDRPSLQHKACADAYPNTYWNYYFFGKGQGNKNLVE